MPSAARIDLSAIPEDQRDAVAALLNEAANLKEIVQRLEHLKRFDINLRHIRRQ